MCEISNALYLAIFCKNMIGLKILKNFSASNAKWVTIYSVLKNPVALLKCSRTSHLKECELKCLILKLKYELQNMKLLQVNHPRKKKLNLHTVWL